MFRITDQEFNELIHDLIRIASILKAIENGSLTPGQQAIIHGCEMRLYEIRDQILQTARPNDKEEKHG